MRTLALILLAACGCRERIVFDTSIPVDDLIPREPATGDELARIQRAADYSEDHRGHAFMVVRGNTVIFESGQNGHGLDEPHDLFSGTKSFTCALFELARTDGHLDADTKVEDTLPGLPADLEVDHLLHLTSGIEADTRLGRDPMRENPTIDDTYAETLVQPFLYEPGEHFSYGAADFNLMGEIVTRTMGDPLDVLTERVFEPIGMRTAGWLRDPAGNPTLALGAWTTANEWAKYGVLVRDDGMFLGERVMEPGLHDCFAGSDANPGYGRAFWLNKDIPDDVEVVSPSRLERDGPLISNEGPDDLVAAAGYNDQRLYIIPSMDLVIVRLGDGGWGFKDRDLLAPFFE